MAEATSEEGNSSASLQAVTKQPVFEFYENFTKNKNEVKGKCKHCKKQIQGQIGITSNFVSHLKVSH